MHITPAQQGEWEANSMRRCSLRERSQGLTDDGSVRNTDIVEVFQDIERRERQWKPLRQRSCLPRPLPNMSTTK